MPSIEDRAAETARKIVGLRDFTSEGLTVQIAAIIATFAKPILKLLAASKREHQEERYDITGCRSLWDPGEACDCGASEWNKRIDEALK